MSKKTALDWPITHGKNDDGTLFYIVNDDQGYNFSFPTREEAMHYRVLCCGYQQGIERIEKGKMDRFREELRS